MLLLLLLLRLRFALGLPVCLSASQLFDDAFPEEEEEEEEEEGEEEKSVPSMTACEKRRIKGGNLINVIRPLGASTTTGRVHRCHPHSSAVACCSFDRDVDCSVLSRRATKNDAIDTTTTTTF